MSDDQVASFELPLNGGLRNYLWLLNAFVGKTITKVLLIEEGDTDIFIITDDEGHEMKLMESKIIKT